MSTRIFIVLAGLVLMMVAFLYLVNLVISNRTMPMFGLEIEKSSVGNQEKSEEQAMQDGRLFEELTIPYLRNKTYSGKIEKMQVLTVNEDYTSYLASYRSDGFLINGFLTRPNSVMPQGGYPAVIFIHGYIPPKQYQTTKNYLSYVDYLARRGLVVFKIDLRGHADSEGEANGAYYSADYVVDVLNAYAALKENDFVNRQSIGLWGHSMAGNIVMRSLAVKPEIPAAVIWAGAVFTYTDLVDYSIQDSSYQPPPSGSPRQKRREELTQTYGLPGAGDSFWTDVAPTRFLPELQGAVQLHHAQNDEVVDIRYSRNLADLLNQTSVPHELYEYSTGGHNLSGPIFELAMQRSVDFFYKYFEKNR